MTGSRSLETHPPGPLFVLRGVRRDYGERPIAFVPATGAGESIVIPRGKMIAVLGLSGSGKTTLLNLLSLLDRADSGTIHYYPVPNEPPIEYAGSMYRKPEERVSLVKSNFGFIFQDDDLFQQLSVGDNLSFPSWLQNLEFGPNPSWAPLRHLGLHEVSELLKRSPGDLSAGQRARVGVLRAVAGPARVIFADEPTANLDAALEERVFRLLLGWLDRQGEDGRSILVSTHRLELARKYCHDFLFLKDLRAPNDAGEGPADDVQHVEVTMACDLAEPPGEQDLKAAIGIEPESSDKSGPQAFMPEVLSARSPLRTFTVLMKHDFWKYRNIRWRSALRRSFWTQNRSRLHLRETMAPLLMILAAATLVIGGGFVIGLMKGSERLYLERKEDDLLWNTVVKADRDRIEQRISNDLYREKHGLLEQHFEVFPSRERAAGERRGIRLRAWTIDRRNPLLGRVADLLRWPKDAGEMRRCMTRFQLPEWGVIISEDAYYRTLGFSEDSLPTHLTIRIDETTRCRLPILGVARYLPDRDMILHPDVLGAYREPGFAQRYLRPDVIRLRVRHTADDGPDWAQNAVSDIGEWLRVAGIGADLAAARFQAFNTGNFWDIPLAPSCKQELVNGFGNYEYVLEGRILSSWGTRPPVVVDYAFPKSFSPFVARNYDKWFLILHPDVEKLRTLIADCYESKPPIEIDEKVEARLDALDDTHGIFKKLSTVLSIVVMTFGALLLFMVIWFDSLRKTREVATMLALGLRRRFLFLAYFVENFLLMLVMFLVYEAAEFLGVWSALGRQLGQARAGAGDQIGYDGGSLLWIAYLVGVSIVVPGLIALVRWFMSRAEPARQLQ